MSRCAATLEEHLAEFPELPRFAQPGVLRRAVEGFSWKDRTALLIGAATLVRLAIAMGVGLTDTEAYYAQWARHPDLSYYDHPPLIAWTSWVAMKLFTSSWAVRLGPVLYAAAFDAGVYALAARLFSPRAGFLAVAVALAIPAYLLMGVILNPEALLMPLWVLFLLLLLSLGEHDERWRPAALGAVIGVAFLAKFTAILAVPVTLLVVASSRPMRRWLARPSFYLGGFVALAVASPVIVWNAGRGWPSLHLHVMERLGQPVVESLGAALQRVALGQLGTFHPLILPALAGVLVFALVRARVDERYRFLALASLPVLAFLLVVMVRATDSEPHWTVVGYLPLVVAAAGWLDGSSGLGRRLGEGYFEAAMLLSGALVVIAGIHVLTPRLAEGFSGYGPNGDPINESLGWDELRGTVEADAVHLGPNTVVAGAHNVLCGHLQAVLDDSPPVYCVSPRRTEFDFIGRRVPPAGSSVIFIDSDRYPEDVVTALPAYRCVPLTDIDVHRESLHVGRFHVFECRPRGAGSPVPADAVATEASPVRSQRAAAQ